MVLQHFDEFPVFGGGLGGRADEVVESGGEGAEGHALAVQFGRQIRVYLVGGLVEGGETEFGFQIDGGREVCAQPQEFGFQRERSQNRDDQVGVLVAQFDRLDLQPVGGHQLDFELIHESERRRYAGVEVVVLQDLECLAVKLLLFDHVGFVYQEESVELPFDLHSLSEVAARREGAQ